MSLISAGSISLDSALYEYFFEIVECKFARNGLKAPWPQNFLISFLTYEYQKNAEFYADLKKVYLEKVICQKLVQVSSIEEYKLQLCTLLLPVTFL